MRKRGNGQNVSIGSIADHTTFPENGAYSAAKFGLRGLHGVLRAELAGSGVRSTLISPGPVDTPLWDEVNPDEREGFTPRAKMLRPEDVAAAVRFVVAQPATVNVDELRLSRA
jgi:NADP-dependent 3-hydroxy acid dehydrogenase YdfG